MADDLAALVETLDLKNAIHIGHSAGAAKSPATSDATVRSASPSRADRRGDAAMLKTPPIPAGLPIECSTISAPMSLPIARILPGSSAPSTAQQAKRQGLARLAGLVLAPRDAWLASKASIDCIKAFSETDLRRSQKFDVPT